MAKYKLLKEIRDLDGRKNPFFNVGNIYDSEYIPYDLNVEELYCLFPQKLKLMSNDTDELSTIYNSLLKMQQAKDKAYGNSALKPLDIFAKHHNYGARLDEKLARVKHSEELRKNDVADLIGGLVLICKDKGWTNFDDLID